MDRLEIHFGIRFGFWTLTGEIVAFEVETGTQLGQSHVTLFAPQNSIRVSDYSKLFIAFSAVFHNDHLMKSANFSALQINDAPTIVDELSVYIQFNQNGALNDVFFEILSGYHGQI